MQLIAYIWAPGNVGACGSRFLLQTSPMKNLLLEEDGMWHLTVFRKLWSTRSKKKPTFNTTSCMGNFGLNPPLLA